ncbi:hypothetical protein M422DRAFT_275371 [Sphaerobolus stellatus SS14]|uniref:Uncharacterized protein n=1 Tax=Sphaerobolus stellatus (strain SS14) TaxID=990650 RepID=A0A0C9T546_SPHS4|nr:hypothetical protein M422DRAFT_275371 [Sphaerobolus stellatus SS14]
MTASFSQYASRFLNNRVAPGSSLASSQPLFYSFQDSEDGEASTERLKVSIQSRDELEHDEHGEPRLRGDEDLDDPYLRLDEDDDQGTLKDSAPLMTSEVPGRQGGWLAHQTSPLPSRSPTPTPPSSPELPIVSPRERVDPQPARSTLTESLLPRDGISRSVFSLPDPGRVPRHKYNDSSWTILWCTGLSICGLAFLLSLFLIKDVPGSTPYATLTRTVPLLTFLTVLCAGLSYIYIALLHYFARPVLIVTALFIPVSLALSAISAFSGSFIYDTASTWADTIGLRLFAVIPLVMAFFAARSFLWYISQINGTIGTVKLSTSLLLSNIPVLVVSPALLFAALLATLPFISLILRLLLLGYRGKLEWSEWHLVCG